METEKKEYKKVNWSFLVFLGFDLALMIYLVVGLSDISMLDNIMIETLLAESMILIPPLIFLMTRKYEEGYLARLGFRKMKLSTFGLVFLYGIVIIPIGTLANSISMLWVDNTVLETSGTMLDAPWYITFISSAIIPPLVEEFSFRGYMYNGYRRDGAGISAVIMSALAFAMMHLNFNQAAYAFIIGIAFAFVVEASGSVWSSILCHFMFNAESVVIMLIGNWIDPSMYDDISVDRAELLESIPSYLIAAGVALVFAVALIYFIAKNQGRLDVIKRLAGPEREKKNIISAPIVVAFIFCLLFMIITV